MEGKRVNLACLSARNFRNSNTSFAVSELGSQLNMKLVLAGLINCGHLSSISDKIGDDTSVPPRPGFPDSGKSENETYCFIAIGSGVGTTLPRRLLVHCIRDYDKNRQASAPEHVAARSWILASSTLDSSDRPVRSRWIPLAIAWPGTLPSEKVGGSASPFRSNITSSLGTM